MVFEYSGGNDDWLSERSAGGNIWNGRERSRMLCYGDWVLTADCVEGVWGNCVERRLC